MDSSLDARMDGWLQWDVCFKTKIDDGVLRNLLFFKTIFPKGKKIYIEIPQTALCKKENHT